MRVPNNALWKVIGDAFNNAYEDDQRRLIDALWQCLSELATDQIEYLDHLKRLKNPLTADAFAPYGLFKTDISLVSTPRVANGVLQDGYGSSFYRWLIFSEEEISATSGSFRIENVSFDYSYNNQLELLSGGYLNIFSCPDVTRSVNTRELVNLSGAYFTSDTDLSGDERWSDIMPYAVEATDAGIKFNPPELNWSAVRDMQHLDGAAAWKQVFVFNIEQWPDPDVRRRHLAVSSFTDTGTTYHVMLEADGGTLKVMAGLEGSEVDLSGDISSLLNDTTNTRLEVVLTYDNVNSRISSDVYLGDSIYSGSATSVSYGRRNHSVDVFNAAVDAPVVYFKYLVVPYGNIWEIDEQSDVDINIYLEKYPYIYNIDDSIVSAKSFAYLPWDLAPGANITSYSDNVISATMEEGWAESVPEYALIGDNFCHLLSQDERDLTYTIVIKGSYIDGDVNIYPWKCTEFDIDDGKLRSKYELPFNSIWLRGAMGREVEIATRFASLYQLPTKADSQEYLDLVRGFHIGMRSHPTKTKMERSISMVLGLPYAYVDGVIDEVNEDSIVIDGQDQEVEAHWNLKILGEEVNKYDTLVHGVKVDDWISAPEKLANRVASPWEQWGSILVSIPADVGVNTEIIDNVISLIMRSKDASRKFLFDFYVGDSLKEELATTDTNFIIAESHQVVDMMFDDMGTVVNGGQSSRLYLAEEQSNGSPTFENTVSLDQDGALDYYRLSRPNYHKTSRYGGKEWVYLPDEDIYLKADANISGYSNPLGMYQPVDLPSEFDSIYGSGAFRYEPKPYDLLWVYDGVTDDLTIYSAIPLDAEWATYASKPTAIAADDTFYSVDYLSTSNIWLAVEPAGEPDDCFLANWDGSTWNTYSVTSNDGVHKIRFNRDDTTEGFVCGTGGMIWKWDGSTSFVDQGIAETENFLNLDENDDYWAFVGENGCVWVWDASFADISDGATNYNGVAVVESGSIWVVGDSGLIRDWNSVDGWGTAVTTGVATNFNDIAIDVDGNIWVVGDSGVIWCKPVLEDWQAFTSPTSSDITAIHIVEPHRIWAVCSDGTIINYNGGEWVEVTSPTLESLLSVSFVDETDGLAVGTNREIIRWN